MSLIKKDVSASRTFYLILFFWFLVDLLQAAFTGITKDESYYALWGKQLAWGYFDHPPMVALFNYLSSLFFSGTLGVRFLTVLAHVGTLLFTWHLIHDHKAGVKAVFLFYILAASLVMFSALGFVTTPDAPLLFFSAFFLWSYKRFLGKGNVVNTLYLSLAMAGMVYSKYQSGLVIGFIVLSNMRLLLKPAFWLAGLGALVLLIPHFYWQYSQQFPSFQYHLTDRSNQFQLRYFLEYVPNQLAVFNPVTLILMVYVLVKYKYKDVFEKGLYYLIIGFLSFFWIMTYRGHVEPHWTVVCSIPMIILLYRKSLEWIPIRKFVERYVFGMVVLILFIRIALVCPPVAGKAGFDEEKRYRAIEKVAGDVPVAFAGSFQNPSLYAFFTHHESFVISSYFSRRTQFDLWQWEKKQEGQAVFVSLNVEGLSQKYEMDGETVTGFFTKQFHSAQRIEVKTSPIESKIWHPGDTIHLDFSIFNPYPFAVDFNDSTFPVQLCACFFTKKIREICPINSDKVVSVLMPSELISDTLYTIVPELPDGSYAFSISVNSIFGPAVQKNKVTIKVAKK